MSHYKVMKPCAAILFMALTLQSSIAFYSNGPFVSLNTANAHDASENNSRRPPEVVVGCQRSFDRKGTTTIMLQERQQQTNNLRKKLKKEKLNSLYYGLQQSAVMKSRGIKLLSYINGSKANDMANIGNGKDRSFRLTKGLRTYLKCVLERFSNNGSTSSKEIEDIAITTTNCIEVSDRSTLSTSLFSKVVDNNQNFAEGTKLSLSTFSTFPTVTFPPSAFQSKDHKMYNILVSNIRSKIRLSSLVLFFKILELQINSSKVRTERKTRLIPGLFENEGSTNNTVKNKLQTTRDVTMVTNKKEERDDISIGVFESFTSSSKSKVKAEMMTEESEQFKEWLVAKSELMYLNSPISKTRQIDDGNKVKGLAEEVVVETKSQPFESSPSLKQEEKAMTYGKFQECMEIKTVLDTAKVLAFDMETIFSKPISNLLKLGSPIDATQANFKKMTSSFLKLFDDIELQRITENIAVFTILNAV